MFVKAENDFSMAFKAYFTVWFTKVSTIQGFYQTAPQNCPFIDVSWDPIITGRHLLLRVAAFIDFVLDECIFIFLCAFMDRYFILYTVEIQEVQLMQNCAKRIA